MAIPIIALGIVGATSLGLGTFFGLKNQEPDQQITKQYQTSYVTQNIDQTKSNEIIIGSNAQVGRLIIKDSMSLDANATAEQQQDAKQSSSKGLDTNLLLIAGGVVGAVFLWRSK